MTNQERLNAAGEAMSEMGFPGLTKIDVRAAVNAIDQWVSDNALSLNSAIPQPARAALTSEQKAQLLKYVVTRRYITGA